MSAYQGWRGFADHCGWDVPDSKSPPPSSRFRSLGAMLDFSKFPREPMLLRPAEDRIESSTALLASILDCRTLPPGLAGKLYGKLMCLSSRYFGRCGRALLRAFSRRQHELSRRGLNPQLVTALNFWIANTKCLRPRQIPFSMKDMPKLVSYSDGEGDKAGVGIAVWFPCGRCIGGYIQLPHEVRGVWSRASTAGADFDIFEIEAVGPALILWNWLKLFPPNCLWIHFIDNDNASASLVKGVVRRA